jgi:periplasmic protein TonB
MDKKAILWPVIISIIIHMTLLAIAGIIDLRDKYIPVDVLSVSIKDPPEKEEKPTPKKEDTTSEKKNVTKARNEKELNIKNGEWREDTINLGTSDVKYVAYLAKIKARILKVWTYPPKAIEKNEEGDVVIKISIDADGRLAGVTLISSSGSVDLDAGALSVVKNAAPYDPLPEIYSLSRLHIIASFDYKIMD